MGFPFKIYWGVFFLFLLLLLVEDVFSEEEKTTLLFLLLLLLVKALKNIKNIWPQLWLFVVICFHLGGDGDGCCC